MKLVNTIDPCLQVEKLEILLFTFESRDGWIFRVECYYAINMMANAEKLREYNVRGAGLIF